MANYDNFDYDNQLKEKQINEAKRKWRDENDSHGAFALTDDEIDYYVGDEARQRYSRYYGF